MGAGESAPAKIKIPEICHIKRAKFQDRLMDVYSAFNLMKYYNDIIKEAGMQNNGRPPKDIEEMNFDEKTVERIKNRNVSNEGPDYKLYLYLKSFSMNYNQVEGDTQRLKLLGDAVEGCYKVLVSFTSNLSDLCDSEVEFITQDFDQINKEKEEKVKKVVEE
jgi:hypothetical protein